jgi:3-hydroxyacyl-[acyl-carrier-protein] dehydratase
MRLVLIDKLTDIQEKSIVGQKYLSVNEEIYEYHFPNNPVFPAAMMFEASLQLARIFFWMKTNFELSIVPAEITKFKFYKVLIPGNILEISETVNDSEFPEVSIVGMANGQNIFSGKFISRVVNFEMIHNKEECDNYINFLKKGN